jgi:hypothetical protein
MILFETFNNILVFRCLVFTYILCVCGVFYSVKTLGLNIRKKEAMIRELCGNIHFPNFDYKINSEKSKILLF